MHKLTLYRQKRQDGGTRTAITINGVNVLHYFEGGKAPPDPVLLWYVDIRCEGKRLPLQPDKAREWLLAHHAHFEQALTQLAEKLAVGLDYAVCPLEWEVPEPPPHVRVAIVCMAVRRVAALQLSSLLKEIRDHWVDILQRLQPLPSLTV